MTPREKVDIAGEFLDWRDANDRVGPLRDDLDAWRDSLDAEYASSLLARLVARAQEVGDDPDETRLFAQQVGSLDVEG